MAAAPTEGSSRESTIACIRKCACARNTVGAVQPHDLIRPLRLSEEPLIQSASVPLAIFDERSGGLQEGHVNLALGFELLRRACASRVCCTVFKTASACCSPACRAAALAPRQPVVLRPLDEVRHSA